MKSNKFVFFILGCFIFFAATHAQNKYGLALSTGKILKSNDTISLAYPSGNAIIFCLLFDANNNPQGKMGVQWSMNGNLLILDTPMVSSQILVDASLALNDQKGYISAKAGSPDAQWINNKVFVKIKGKNAKTLFQTIPFKETAAHPLLEFDCFGRVQIARQVRPFSIVIFRDERNKISSYSFGRPGTK